VLPLEGRATMLVEQADEEAGVFVAKTGLCADCGSRIALDEEGVCANDHPREMIRDVREQVNPAEKNADGIGPTWAVGVSGGELTPLRRSTVLLGGIAVVVFVLAAVFAGGFFVYQDARGAMTESAASVGSGGVPGGVVMGTTGGSPPAPSLAPSAPLQPAKSAAYTPARRDLKSAMAPTIVSGQHYSVSEGAYRGKGPRIGDIVAIESPSGRRGIRRVVGLAGDSVQVTEGWVYRDGVALKEPYVRYNDARFTIGAMLVPKGAVFVIGDNRDRLSKQFWGVVTYDDVLGKVRP